MITTIKFDSLEKANRARKWLLSEIPMYALEFVKIIDNTTKLNQFILEEILTQIPIQSNDDNINEKVFIKIINGKLLFSLPLNTLVDLENEQDLNDLIKIQFFDFICMECKIVKKTPKEGGIKFSMVNSIGIDLENRLIIEHHRKSLKTLNFEMFFCFFDK